MVWKKINKYFFVCFACMIMCFSTSIHAYAYQIYEGSISSTYLTYFNQILSKHSPVDDYIVFRNGQYEYIMLVGDLSVTGDTFTGSKLTEYSVRAEGTTYNSNYKIYKTDNKTLSLNVGNEVIYSNLGHYPNIIERSDIYEFSTFTLISIVGMCLLVRPMFKFTLRSR